jgi:hypothetical protein
VRLSGGHVLRVLVRLWLRVLLRLRVGLRR